MTRLFDVSQRTPSPITIDSVGEFNVRALGTPPDCEYDVKSACPYYHRRRRPIVEGIVKIKTRWLSESAT
jgi:hypothetical protein